MVFRTQMKGNIDFLKTDLFQKNIKIHQKRSYEIKFWRLENNRAVFKAYFW